MQIEISEDTYRAIATVATDVSKFVEQAAQDALEKIHPLENPRFDATQVLAQAGDLQGMFGEASLEEVLADRRCGLE